MNRGSAGFSLVETVVVVALGAVLIGLAAHSALPPGDLRAAEAAARGFQALVREARLMGMEHRTPTRLVFVPRALANPVFAGEGPEEAYVECALYRFVIPAPAAREVSWRAPAEENAVRGGDVLERIAVAPPGLPEELVGQWQRSGARPLRFARTLGREIEVRSEVLDRFAEQAPEVFAAENGFKPRALWAAGTPQPWSGWCQASPYPPHYHRTPWPEGPTLEHRPLPSSARLFDPQMQRWRPASDFWPGEVSLPHFAGMDEVVWLDLPYLEFDGQGHLQARWEGAKEVTFGVAGKPQAVARVIVGSGDLPVRVTMEAR